MQIANYFCYRLNVSSEQILPTVLPFGSTFGSGSYVRATVWCYFGLGSHVHATI